MLNYQAATVKVFQALADPTRFAIIDRLSHGPASVTELAKPFDISLAGVVQHIQALENAGLIVTKKSGRSRLCRINPDVIRDAETWLSERIQFWERQFDQLADIFKEAPFKEDKEK